MAVPSIAITVLHHSTSLVMVNRYPRDGIFNPHLTTIILTQLNTFENLSYSSIGFGYLKMKEYPFTLSALLLNNNICVYFLIFFIVLVLRMRVSNM